MSKYENISMYSSAPVTHQDLKNKFILGGRGNLKHLVYDIQISLTN